MRDATPKTTYLRDYSPFAFLVESIELVFELDEADTRVVSRLRIKQNPKADRYDTLTLDGEHLALESIRINAQTVDVATYTCTDESLTLYAVPDRPFELEIITRIYPKANTALEGLYSSDGMLCTQCEAQGFRRITYFPDRPDIMTRFTATLIANQERFPVLLANGNPVASGQLQNGRHWVKWEDPHPKPSYLFALVAGRLDCLEERITDGTGREIRLQLYAESRDIAKCGHAIQSLKEAMRWDEAVFGRVYDLDVYMIVAVSHFNMGAMENKGLNIFNTKFVLASPETATDTDYEGIEGVIAHEYFHNWTGNRITCRDWFQLSLKEGLTVFRDQEFSASRHSVAVKRIDEVDHLRTRQFAEDAGPLAHPVQPASYIEINNFYTLTVYEKGAEVVRMMQTLLGSRGFRLGTDLYFDRHDGEAVTCDDFVRCMEEANEVDLTQFRLWYCQAGTPELHLTESFDAQTGVFNLTVRQTCPPTPGQPGKRPFHIPFALGLLGPGGESLPVRLADEDPAKTWPITRVLELRDHEHSFQFDGLSFKPVISPLRGFSAPVKLQTAQSATELFFLSIHDPDTFNRWNAGQQVAVRIILERMAEPERPLDERLIDAFRSRLAYEHEDLAYAALMLGLPAEDYLHAAQAVIDPEATHSARQAVRRDLAKILRSDFERVYAAHSVTTETGYDPTQSGRRRLKNVCLSYLNELNDAASHAEVLKQYHQARNMTDRIAALTCIVNSDHPEKQACLEHFYAMWEQDALVIDKWFALQATGHWPGTLDRVQALLTHPAFELTTPNRVRSLVGAFTQSNPASFHAIEGGGYRFLADRVQELDAINPQIAARMLSALTNWRRYDEVRQTLMREQLQRIVSLDSISRDVYEVASKSLESAPG
ncbi:MAG: aminopeptidase N [Methylococcaceae bacterium]